MKMKMKMAKMKGKKEHNENGIGIEAVERHEFNSTSPNNSCQNIENTQTSDIVKHFLSGYNTSENTKQSEQNSEHILSQRNVERKNGHTNSRGNKLSGYVDTDYRYPIQSTDGSIMAPAELDKDFQNFKTTNGYEKTSYN